MIKGSVYLVTGGNSGLGKATVELLLSEGAKIVVFDLKIDNIISDENVLGIEGNVASEEDTQKVIAQIKEKFGKLNGVINCAGILLEVNFTPGQEPPSLEAFTKVLTVNTIGTFNVIRLAVPLISENTPNEDGERGVIIMTASVAAFDFSRYPGYAAYSASKAAIVGMTMPLAKDLSDRGIRVVTVAPCGFLTPMLGDVKTKIPVPNHFVFPKRWGKPAEYARLAKVIIETPMLNATTIRLDAGTR